MLRAAAALALGSAVVPLTGCDLFDGDGGPAPAPDPLAPLVDESLRLAAGLRATAVAHPALAGRLIPLAEAHEIHAAELGRLVGASPSAAPTPTVTVAAPIDPDRAVAALRRAERAGRDSAVAAATAAPAERAALVGSVAAARASHLEALR
ncbi:hypothetical protein [Micromonospora nigra]|uniref:hypothetical protein n=1 Tax=Micromonospora nigra TaxID=145857 RepID=UPI000B822709|nr:hypothetical protein [Micromonospora nigra]